MVEFVGRELEIRRLRRHLGTVGEQGTGVLLSIRGRRQVGKSRLIEEFLRHADAPGAFFTAARAAPAAAEVRSFVSEIADSSLPAAATFTDAVGRGAAAARLPYRQPGDRRTRRAALPAQG